jgi:hypothetical protein
MKTAEELKEDIKYVPWLEEIPRWSSWSYKQSGSKWIDPSVWIFLSLKEKKEISQEIYESYMRKGEEDKKRYEILRGRRRRQTIGTVSVMLDRMEKGNEKEVTVREGGKGESGRLTVMKGIPDLQYSDVGEISKPVDGRVRKFLYMYKDILKKQNHILLCLVH